MFQMLSYMKCVKNTLIISIPSKLQLLLLFIVVYFADVADSSSEEDVPPPRKRGCATPERERMCHPQERDDVPPEREREDVPPPREREVTCHYIRSLFQQQQQHNTKNRQALNINDSLDIEKGKKKCVTYNTCPITINITRSK